MQRREEGKKGLGPESLKVFAKELYRTLHGIVDPTRKGAGLLAKSGACFVRFFGGLGARRFEPPECGRPGAAGAPAVFFPAWLFPLLGLESV